jgi:DNA mismatch repair protein MutH
MNSYNEARQALEPAIGVPFKELAPALGIPLPKDPTKRKSGGGDIAEKLLEVAKNSIPKPDLVALGTEVKAISLNTLSIPRDWTKIRAFNLGDTKKEPDFYRSSPFHKLRLILFVPIMKVDEFKPDFWYLRTPFLWLPTEKQLDELEADYIKIQKAAMREDWTPNSGLTGRPGTFLTLNTADSKTKGKAHKDKRRAWYLTKDITDGICQQNLWPRESIQERAQALANAGESSPQPPA